MKKIFFILFLGLAFLFQNCKRYDLKLTGIEGKIVDKFGLPIDSARINYQITEPSNLIFGFPKLIEDSTKISDKNGNFKIAKYCKSYQNFRFYVLAPIKGPYGLQVVSNSAKLGDYIKGGNYYEDVIITMSY